MQTDGVALTVTGKNNLSGEGISTAQTRSSAGLCITLLAFLSFGLCYSYYTPLWNPPDEERHFAYLEYIAQNNKLPCLKLGPESTHIAQAIHPPLYYLIASLFCKDDGNVLAEELAVNDGPGFNTIVHPYHNSRFPYAGKARTAHLLRYFSLALSSVTICFIYLIVLAIFPGKTLLASATALFAGMNPQFLHISASVSNENLSNAFSTIYLFVLLCYLKYPFKTKHHLAAGTLLGCCLLSKISTAFYVPLTICVIGWVTVQHKRKMMASLLPLFGMAALVAGWWYLRNWLVFNDPLLTKFLIDSQPWSLHSTPFSWAYATTLLSNTFVSFFGNFGALQISLPKPYLAIYGGIVVLGIAGICRALVKREFQPLQAQALGIIALALLGGGGIFALLNMKYIGVSMGRYLFVVIAPIAIGTCLGCYSLFPYRWRNPVLLVLSLVLIILNLDIFFRVVKPAYAESLLTAGEDQSLFSYPTAEINRDATLAQTFVSPENNLSAIRVMFSAPNRLKGGEISFALIEGPGTEKVLHQITLPLKEIDDLTRYFFIFPPIKNSRGKAYMLRFSTSHQPAGRGVSLWYEPDNVYPRGEILLNGRSLSGDLYFTTYHFTGDSPETDWQGRQLTVIHQGQYVGLRELQLYHERSRAFREQTTTHEKILRIKKALDNRKSAALQR